MNTPLTGNALIEYVEKNSSRLGKRDLAKGAGYSAGNRVNLTKFYTAVLAAKGLAIDGKSEVRGSGRVMANVTSVHQNGQIVVGAGYTEQLNLPAGTVLKINLRRRSKKIVLEVAEEQAEEAVA